MFFIPILAALLQSQFIFFLSTWREKNKLWTSAVNSLIIVQGIKDKLIILFAGTLNVSQNQIRSYNENDIINKPMSKTMTATAPTNLISSAFHSPSHLGLTSSYSDNNYQINIVNELNKRSKFLISLIISEFASITIIVHSLKLCKPLFTYLFFSFIFFRIIWQWWWFSFII